MARGTAFSELVLQLRAELRRSQSPAVGVEDIASLKQTLNRNAQVLALRRNWEFLLRKFPRITINAGQRYYDLPAGLDLERITVAKVKYGGSFYHLARGINFEDYEAFDPEENERSSPALKWGTQFDTTANRAQIEIWPLPDSSAQYLYFEGYQRADVMVSDDDRCLVDDTVTVLLSAAELLMPVDAAGAKAKVDIANEHLRLLGLRASLADQAPVQIGLQSGRDRFESGRAVVRISGMD